MIDSNAPPRASGMTLKLILAWGFVGIPLAWGFWITLKNAARIF